MIGRSRKTFPPLAKKKEKNRRSSHWLEPVVGGCGTRAALNQGGQGDGDDY
jgi:hypothetical protein